MIKIPEYVMYVLKRLEEGGFEAYPVGGCVRDSVRGVEPEDWDIATSALPGQVEEIFEGLKVIETGIKHGTVTVISEGHPLETTTFRTEGEYIGHRRPSRVEFVSSLTEDLRRRDLTVNAMACSPKGEIIDPFGGLKDMKKGILRAVGDPEERFEEDALRIMRTARFQSALGWQIEEKTMAAMEKKAGLLKYISGERIFAELKKLVMGGHVLTALTCCGRVLASALPEIEATIGFDQRNRHHIYDVWQHTARALALSEKDLYIRLALLFHDVGKPLSFTVDAKGEGHFYAHAKLSAEMTDRAMERLRADRRTREEVVWLVAMHDWSVTPEEKTAAKMASKWGFERSRRLLKIKAADNAAQSPAYRQRGKDAEALLKMLDELEETADCLTLKDLAVRGGDLLALGMRGPEIGESLDMMLRAVVEGRCPNSREALLTLLKN